MKLAIVLLTLWATGVIVMSKGGVTNVVNSVTMPHVITATAR